MRKFFVLVLLSMLAACGGGAAVAGPCAVPSEIVMGRGHDGVMRKYEKATPSAPYVLTATGDDAFRAIHDCPGTGTQYLHFKMASVGFFQSAWANPPAGGHLAVLGRADIDLSVVRHIARGFIFDRAAGVLGERYYRDDPAPGRSILQCPGAGSCPAGAVAPSHPVTMVSDVTYNVETESSAGQFAYNVFKTSTGQNAASSWAENYDHVNMTGTRIAFATLCENGCNVPFTIRIFDISAGWK